MKYQDNPHLTDKEYSILKANYEKTQAQESEDLIELLHKMQEQLETLTSSNVDGKYDEIISKLSGSISDLEKLINTNHSQFLHKIKKFGAPPNTFSSKSPSLQSYSHPHAPNQIPNPWEAPNSYNLHKLEDGDNPNENTQNEDLSNSKKSPENSENKVDNTPSNNDTSDDLSSDNGNNDVDSNNNESNLDRPQNKNKRNSPQQINPIFNALKSLNVNLNNSLNRLFGKNSSKKNQNVHTSHKPMPPQYPPYECPPNTPPNKYPHRPFPPQHIDDTMDECDISDICKNKQIDIVRLFLLYMMLTPTCHYLPTITTIANTQFEILMQLM